SVEREHEVSCIIMNGVTGRMASESEHTASRAECLLRACTPRHVAALRDAPAEWSLQFDRLGLIEPSKARSQSASRGKPDRSGFPVCFWKRRGRPRQEGFFPGGRPPPKPRLVRKKKKRAGEQKEKKPATSGSTSHVSTKCQTARLRGGGRKSNPSPLPN